LYISTTIIRVFKLRRMGICSHMGDIRNAYKILVRKSGGRKPLGRCRCTRVNNIGVDIKEIWWEVLDWIHVA
jgi:hypothetical protein